MTAAPSWLEVMPAIPLARGVPVALRWHNGGVRRGVLLPLPSTGEGFCVLWGKRRYPDGLNTAARVDLDDPQGFAYVLRWLAGTSAGYDEAMLSLWVRGDTRDEDSLALARACAKVVGGSR